MPLSPRVLVVEDDLELRLVLMRGLEEEGFSTTGFGSGRELLDGFSAETTDLLLLDVGLPDADGRDICQALRARGVQTPVLFLTARDALTDRVTGFSAGGDDYVAKPFAFAELVARIRALLRRASTDVTAEAGGLLLDPVTHAAFIGDHQDRSDPDRVPPARQARRTRGRDRSARRSDPHRVASRRPCARKHARRVHRAPPAQAARRSGRTHDLDVSRRRVHAGMKSWDPRRNVHARLLAIVVGALALALAASTYGFNVLYARSTSRSADSLLRARASSELGLLSLRHGRLVASEIRNDSLGDSQVWIFTPTGTLERPNSSTRLDAVASALAGGPRRLQSVHGDDRLYAVPIVIHGRREGTLVTGLSLAPYKQSQSTALRGSLALALVMLTLVGAAVWWLLRSALRPVARMTEQAAAWSEHDLDRRFGLGEPNDELTQLAATLDGLLDRLAASLRHERRFSAELSHELRTPLSRLIAEAELALRRERPAPEYRLALEAALRNAHQVARIVETLVAAAQHEAGARGTADAYGVAADAVGEVSRLASAHDVSVVVDPPQEPLRVGVDGDLAERVLQPVIENACRYARTWARVTVTRRDSTILYLIEDDGPGVELPERETIFEPGVRGSAGRNETGSIGAGLGLALARRLARTAAGDIVVEPNGDGGRFLVALPAA